MKTIIMDGRIYLKPKNVSVLKRSGIIFSAGNQNTKDPKGQALQESGFKKHKEGTAEILHPQLGSGFERL